MSKLLYIKANSKPEGLSRTFKISDSFIEAYKQQNPNDEIIMLDLYKENIGFLTEDDLTTHITRPQEYLDHPIIKYANQFASADKYVFAEPMWNLSIPAILMAYLDYVCINGITFKYTENGPVGLCHGKKAINIVSRGGEYSVEPFSIYEMGNRYLRTICGFLGIIDFVTIAADKLDIITEDANKLIQNAINDALIKAKSF